MSGRTAFFNKLGLEYANSRWSWCAVQHERREVYFGVWDTLSTGASSIVLSEDWEMRHGRRLPGYSDAINKIALIEAKDYKLIVFRMIQGQENFVDAPSIIKRVEEDLIEANICKVGRDWFAMFQDATDEPSESLPVNGIALFPEGAKHLVITNAHERNVQARAACISHYGATCQACKFDFEDFYGSFGRGFIHVHHVNPIAATRSSYFVDPIRDLVPLCPNCHAMVHRTEPPLDVRRLREIIRKRADP